MPRCPGCKEALTEATEEDTTLYCDGGEHAPCWRALLATVLSRLHHFLRAGCGKRFKAGVGRWCCSTCDFDVCQGCTIDVVTEQADLAAAEADEAIRRILEAEAEEEAEEDAVEEAASTGADEAEAEPEDPAADAAAKRQKVCDPSTQVMDVPTTATAAVKSQSRVRSTRSSPKAA